jgi:serine O-acetyltransferase
MPYQRIESFSSLKYFLAADRISLGYRSMSVVSVLVDPVWKFQIVLRLVEYLTNCHPSPFGQIVRALLWWRLRSLRIRLGFSIPLNVFGPGLSIAHYGTIVVNKYARIGENCRIHPGVCIGVHRGAVPIIGDNVYFGPGAKVFGRVVVGNDAAIGANAVVTHDVSPNTTVIGAPARTIAEVGSGGLVLCGSVLALEKNFDWTKLGSAEALLTEVR